MVRARRTLLKRLRDRAPRGDGAARATTTRRTAGELLLAADARKNERELHESERLTRERARREAEVAAKREQYLEELTGRQEETWTRIETLITSKLPKSYDEARAGRVGFSRRHDFHALLNDVIERALFPNPKDRFEGAEQMAFALEHYISEELELLIAAKLGEPSHDPHGTPIPGPDLLPPIEKSGR